MWPNNERSRGWRREIPSYINNLISSGKPNLESQTNSLKRSHSERQSRYDPEFADTSRRIEASAFTPVAAAPLSPGSQFHISSHSQAPASSPRSFTRESLQFRPSGTPIVSNLATKVSHSSAVRLNSSLTIPEMDILESSTVDHEMMERAESASQAQKSIVELDLDKFVAYLRREESNLYEDYFASASVSIKRANHMNEVERIACATRVPLSDSSPFAGMTTIRQQDQSRSAQDSRLVQHVFRESASKAVEHAYTYPVRTFFAPSYQVPPYTHYVSSKRNALVEGDKQRTFLPYLGESTDNLDGDYEVLEKKILINLKRANDLQSNEEFAKPWILRIDDILEDLGTSTEAVLRLLLDEDMLDAPPELPPKYAEIFQGRQDWIVEGFYEEEHDIDATRDKNTEKAGQPQRQWRVALNNLPQVTGHALAAAALACYSFMDVCRFSLFHVVRLTPTAARACQQMDDTDASSTDSTPASLHTYMNQTCLVCKSHQCFGHGEFSDDEDDERQRIPMTSQMSPDAVYERAEKAMAKLDPTNDFDLKVLLGREADGNVSGNPWTLLSNENSGLGDDEVCSPECFWEKSNRTLDVARSAWSTDDESLLAILGPAQACHRRGACALSRMGVIAKTCVEIFYKLVNMSSSLEECQAAKKAEGHEHPNKPWKWWLENTDTWRHERREPFRPCSHVGKCKGNPNCSCTQQRISCEKSCNCPSVCPRRFRGCRCHAMNGACISTESCDCRALNRECDPDLCFACGAAEVLDPTNRYDEKAVKNKCANVPIQRSVPKRTQIGQSKLLSAAGLSSWGLYMGEEARKGDYLGEYVGEIVTLEESEQRGTIYNAMKLSYLFDLNSKQVLDSTPIGNKLRYINHQGDDFANCQAKVMFCGGVQRIAIFCTKNIKLGEELFFNYGEGFASKVDMVKLHKDGTVTIEKANKATESKGKTSAHKKLPNDIEKPKPRESTRTALPLSFDGIVDENDNKMEIDAADVSSAEEEEDTYEDLQAKPTGQRKKILSGGMSGSDRMRKAWISRYRNLGQLEQAEEQEKKFNKSFGKQ